MQKPTEKPLKEEEDLDTNSRVIIINTLLVEVYNHEQEGQRGV